MEKLSTKLGYLVCSLYTLSEYHQLFKKLDLKNDIYINISNGDRFSRKIDNLGDFYLLLNKASLRRFTNFLITPIKSFEKEENYNETILLKKYLRKFKYHYRRYFFYQNGNYLNLPTNKELNGFAVKMLFLLTGI